MTDPQFMLESTDPGLADFRLQPSSPAIDRLSSPYPEIDLAQTPRPQGSAADLGAFEAVPEPELLAGLAAMLTRIRAIVGRGESCPASVGSEARRQCDEHRRSA